MTLKRLAAAAAALAALAAVYRNVVRQPILTWGATAEEAAARLPGDELLERADGIATRAITIDAPPSAVWPWIAQVVRARAAARTPTTGSRTCSAWTCTAPTRSFPTTSTRRSATGSATAPT